MTPYLTISTNRGTMYSYRLRNEKGSEAMKNTKVTVTVTYEMEYDGKVTQDDIDINDVIRDTDTIKDIKVKTKKVRN